MYNRIVSKLKMLCSNLGYFLQSRRWKRDNRIILFGAWFGTRFADNSRYLFQYLSKNKESLGLDHVVWVTRNEALCQELNALGYEAYMMDSEESLYYHKKAGMHIICNSASYKNKNLLPDIHPELSCGAKRINLWHGVGVIKGVGCASLEYKKRKEKHKFIYGLKELLDRSKLYRLVFGECGGWGDFYFLSTTPAATKQFKEFAYTPDENFLHTLYPRVCECPELLPEEKQVISVMGNYKKVILYVPTFRTGNNSFDFSGLAEELKDELIRQDILWVQKSHSASSISTQDSLENHIMNLSPDFDINVIMPYISLLITDYSSAMSDARFFHKPVLFYVPDFEEYMNGDNGITEEAEELMCGPLCRDVEELRREIAAAFEDETKLITSEYEEIRRKYWGQEKSLSEVWEDILRQVK